MITKEQSFGVRELVSFQLEGNYKILGRVLHANPRMVKVLTVQGTFNVLPARLTRCKAWSNSASFLAW